MSKTNGIYVAFDGKGRHFAYAKHPEAIRSLMGLADPEFEAREQRRTINAYRAQAKRLGGCVEYLSPEEYRKRVIESPND